MTTRRDVLTGAVAGTMAAVVPARAAPADAFDGRSLYRDVVAYDAFGVHRTGSRADRATTEWLARHLRSHRFAVEQRPFAAELYQPIAQAMVGGSTIPLVTQEIFPAEDFDAFAPLANVETATAGTIALARFRYDRDASLAKDAYLPIVTRAAAQGAVALIAVTEGPTGQVIVFNTTKDGKPTPLPVLLVAPDHAAPLVAGAAVRIRVRGRRLPVRAFNTTGRIDRGRPVVVVSTPQSGWTHCAGERGPGIALWRALAAWASAPSRKLSYTFMATSGHELAHAGLGEMVEHGDVLRGRPLAAWLHLGANIATYDYERGKAPLRMLATANAERGAAANAELLPHLTAAFAGLPGFPVAPLEGTRAFGEAKQIAAAGFAPLAGLVGSGVLHHVAADRAGVATGPELLEPVARSLLVFLNGIESAAE